MAEAYSRIYHRLMTEYPSVWRDARQLGLFVQLLVAAEKFYPQPAAISHADRHFRALVSAGLVIDLGDRLYTIRGLAAERERRTTHGRTGAAVRWHSDRSAMPMLDETRRDEKENSANAQNGSSPTPASFMGFKQKPTYTPDLKEIERLHEQARREAHDAVEERQKGETT